MPNKYLPIGTVVTLKGATIKLMITGFCVMDKTKQDKVYDYSGLPFPVGEFSEAGKALFNHSQIEIIEHMGLMNEEEAEFKKNLDQLIIVSGIKSGE